MKIKSKSIGSFEAKTHLSSLLENVQNGVEYTITKRGKPVAKLIPYINREENIKIEEIIRNFGTIRNSTNGKVEIKELIKEGRKY